MDNKEKLPPISPLKHFNWENVMHHLPTSSPGAQIFHFNSVKKPYNKDPKAVEFVVKYLKGAKIFDSDADILRYASDVADIKDGLYLEMGTATCRTINFIAALNPKKNIYGFDSYDGLPTDWDRGNEVVKVNAFGIKDKNFIPPVLKNIEIYKGIFSSTLASFKKYILKESPIALLHIDCDLYQSTKDVFDNLGDNIISGTIRVFDEFYNYPNYEQHEFKAFQEFLIKHKLEAEYIAYNDSHEQVAVRIK